VIDPPSDNVETGGSRSRWRFAIRWGAPGKVCSSVNTKARGAWRQRKFRQAIVAVVVMTKALSTWRLAVRVPRQAIGKRQRLVVHVSRQAISLQQIGVMLVMMCVIYMASRIS